jgi:hypothetical protein
MAVSVTKKRAACIKKFLYYFPKGYAGKKFVSWERDYKWQAHLAWEEGLEKKIFQSLLADKAYEEIVYRAVRVESKTNLLFSFEKMALRDGVKGEGAKIFALGLFDLVHGKKEVKQRFQDFSTALAALPRKQTRVLTWPLQTVFGFIAQPKEFIFLKPRVTQAAAIKYDFDFAYKSKPNWYTYQSLLDFAALIKKDTAHLQPRDMIDLQSFIWVMGSEEYPD